MNDDDDNIWRWWYMMMMVMIYYDDGLWLMMIWVNECSIGIMDHRVTVSLFKAVYNVSKYQRWIQMYFAYSFGIKT
jgi:hypothetical protein